MAYGIWVSSIRHKLSAVCQSDPHDTRQMIDHCTLVHQPARADDVKMKHLVVLKVAQDSRRIFTALNGMDRRQPELAHLNNAAVREAKMFCRSVSDPALADLRRGVLAVNRCHVEFYLRSAHERRRLRCVQRRPFRPLRSSRQIELQ